MVIVMMGPAGAGKTTVGRALADSLGWPFVEGDDHHAPASIGKIRRGEPLTEHDRAGWLARLHVLLARSVDRREPLVLSCSALKASHRATLRGDLRGVRFVFLSAPREVLQTRLAKRQGHFAGPAILESQLADLEPPTDAIVLDATATPGALVDRIRHELGV
jgi:gluconokinase